MKSVVILPHASKELIEAKDYYAQEFPEVSHAFIEEFLHSVEFIRQFPEAWQKVGPNTHKCILKRFPFLVLYTIEESRIVITSVAHQHRHPDSYLR
jgi:plasmid stabilization system protein ParE